MWLFHPFWTHNGSIMEVVLDHVGPIPHMYPHTLRGVYKGTCAPQVSGGCSGGLKYRVCVQIPYLDTLFGPLRTPQNTCFGTVGYVIFWGITQNPVSLTSKSGVSPKCALLCTYLFWHLYGVLRTPYLVPYLDPFRTPYLVGTAHVGGVPWIPLMGHTRGIHAHTIPEGVVHPPDGCPKRGPYLVPYLGTRYRCKCGVH
jgi:hypothetical protein